MMGEAGMLKKQVLVTTPDRSRLMAKVRQSGTGAEIAVQKIVRDCGYTYKTKETKLSGSPDIVNIKDKWAIFVNGCFWHAHDNCSKWKIPKRNREFWEKKFNDNRIRDARNFEELKKIGYSVLVIWECELKNLDTLKSKVCLFLESAK
jgi:DNA mismatch endonuclease (patch repair protein)